MISFGIVVLIIFIVYLYLRWVPVKRYWANLNVPHNSPSPLYGSLTFLLKQNVFLWLLDYKSKFKSPYVGIWLFWKPALLVNSPELARRVLLKDSEVFKNRLMKTSTSDLVSRSMLFLKDEAHSSLKRNLHPAFTAARVKMFENVLSGKTLDLIQRVRVDTGKGKLIDLRAIFTDYTTDITSKALFGLPGNATLTGDSPMRKIAQDFMSFDIFRDLAWGCIIFFPALAEFFGFTFFPKISTEYLKRIFDSAVAERESNDTESFESVQDFLYYLIKLKKGFSRDNKDLEDDFLLAQAAFVFEAGFDTAALSLTHLVYEVAFAPHVQDKLYEELKDAKNKNGEKGFDSKTLSDLIYLNCVIKESFRKHPPLPLFDRVAAEDYKIDENLTVREGTPVFINVVGLHYDLETYSNPQEFDPNRFLPENEHKLKPFTFLPFGEGPRYCIGRRLGLQMLQYILAELVFHFEIHPAENSPRPTECGYEKKLILLTPDRSRIVNFVPRNCKKVNPYTN